MTQIFSIIPPVADIRATADPTGPRLTQLVYGETVTLEQSHAHAKAQTAATWVRISQINGQSTPSGIDAYIKRSDISPQPADETFPQGQSHCLNLPFAVLYYEPSQLYPSPVRMPFGAQLKTTGNTAPFLYPSGAEGMAAHEFMLPVFSEQSNTYRTEPRWIISSALRESGHTTYTLASCADLFLETPYLPGGRSYLGLDEAGLLSLSLSGAGLSIGGAGLSFSGAGFASSQPLFPPQNNAATAHDFLSRALPHHTLVSAAPKESGGAQLFICPINNLKQGAFSFGLVAPDGALIFACRQELRVIKRSVEEFSRHYKNISFSDIEYYSLAKSPPRETPERDPIFS